MENKTIKGYKGFDKDLKCRDFQYEVGKEYSTEKAVACNTGFHYCENPMDVLGFYAPCDDTGNLNRFCEVEGSGDFDKSESDKICCTHLKVKAEIGLQGLIKAGVKFILDRVKWEDNKQSNTGDYSLATNTGDYSLAINTGDRSLATNTGNYSLATNTGNYSLATNTGNYSLATNTGDYSLATNTGDYSLATNTGDYSLATNTGDYSLATNTGYRSLATNIGDRSLAANTGDYSLATNTGYRSLATNTGDYSVATNTGNYSVASVEGKESIVIVTGKASKAKGALGCWVVLTERGEWDGDTYPILDVKSFKVDGEVIKADTWYKLIDGKAVEVE